MSFAFFRLRIARCACALSAATLMLVHVAMAADNVSFTTDTLRFFFQPCSAGVVEWKIDAGFLSGKNEWKSIVTKAHGDQPISRHLYLDGIGPARTCRHYSMDADGVAFGCPSHDGRLNIRTTLQSESGYRLVLRLEIENISDEALSLPDGVRMLLGPGLGEYPVDGFGVAEKMYSFVEPVLSQKGNVNRIAIDGGSAAYIVSSDTLDWYGLHSRYFALLLSPLGDYANTPSHLNFNFHAVEDDSGIPPRYLPMVSVDLSIDSIDPLQSIERRFVVFSGPKSSAVLKSGQPDFSRLLFFGLWGWMEALCLGLLWVLKIIHRIVPSWGVSIIMLAVFVRIVLYPFARKALASQKAFSEVQRKIRPEMLKIKQCYTGGEQSEKILELYKMHGVSPFAGLKPLLIVLVQVPVFVALFHVLGKAYELRDVPFLWIPSLSEPDRLFRLGIQLPFFGEYFNALPVLMAATTMLTMKMSPTPAGGRAGAFGQNFFLVFMTVSFFVLFYAFPSGMVLYWTVANVLQLLQHYIFDTSGESKHQRVAL